MLKSSLLAVLLMTAMFSQISVAATRIKDIASVRGVRSNGLHGLGMVVGLKGSGDTKKNVQTSKAMAQLMTKLGLPAAPEDMVSGSVALVMVTAELPPFGKSGDRIDVKIATVGDAKSLAGGSLIMTPLTGADGSVYAIASGAVVVGQASGSGPQVLTVALVPQGAVVEKEIHPSITKDSQLTLQLHEADFTTNQRAVEAINQKLSGFYANSLDISSIQLTIPEEYQSRVVEFISEIEGVQVEVDRRAVVVVNERTGTIVMGSDVHIAPIVITHGDLSVKIGGSANKGDSKRVAMVKGSTVGELIDALNQLGVKPADLVGILQAVEAAKALEGELKFL